MSIMKNMLIGIGFVISSVSFAQQPAVPTKAPAKAVEKKNAPAKAAPAAPAAGQTAAPAAPAAPAGQAAPATGQAVESQPRTLESQPGTVPNSNPGDTYEQNPTELQQMACELNALIKAAEAKASANEAPETRASREALIVSRKRELKGALSVYKKVTGQSLNLDTACQ